MTALFDALDGAATSLKSCEGARQVHWIDMIGVVTEVRQQLAEGQATEQVADYIFRRWGFRVAVSMKGDDLYLNSSDIVRRDDWRVCVQAARPLQQAGPLHRRSEIG